MDGLSGHNRLYGERMISSYLGDVGDGLYLDFIGARGLSAPLVVVSGRLRIEEIQAMRGNPFSDLSKITDSSMNYFTVVSSPGRSAAASCHRWL